LQRGFRAFQLAERLRAERKPAQELDELIFTVERMRLGIRR
jgi:hypothetical protein